VSITGLESAIASFSVKIHCQCPMIATAEDQKSRRFRTRLAKPPAIGRDGSRAARVPAGSRNPDILILGMATTTTIQVRGRGTLTLPASLREKYRLGEGDPLTVVDLDGAVLLSPRVLVVPRLAAEMERLRRARKLALKDLGGPARED
jgi:bifunctional DNA-binding transcriptional regulator/antitoxin component of YhaV-PrlF toxin-antitoxin module